MLIKRREGRELVNMQDVCKYDRLLVHRPYLIKCIPLASSICLKNVTISEKMLVKTMAPTKIRGPYRHKAARVGIGVKKGGEKGKRDVDGKRKDVRRKAVKRENGKDFAFCIYEHPSSLQLLLPFSLRFKVGRMRLVCMSR